MKFLADTMKNSEPPAHQDHLDSLQNPTGFYADRTKTFQNSMLFDQSIGLLTPISALFKTRG
jgi:hypothetical protein